METSILANTPQHIAEQSVLRLLRDPEIIELQDRLRAELAAMPRARSATAAERIDLVITQWSAALIIDELSYIRRDNPAFVIGTDTTPRHWMGHSFPGNGKAGDNPDMISRSTVIDGRGQYEVTGQIDPARPPIQLVTSIFAGTMTHPAEVKQEIGATPNPDAGIFRQIGSLTEKDLNIAADGSFRILLGGQSDGGAHLPTEPIPCSFGFRQMMLDWRTPPMRLSIRRLDCEETEGPDLAAHRDAVLADLEGFVRFWAGYGDVWLGGIEPNEIVAPVPREGGWGYLSAAKIKLAPGEAALAVIDPGEAKYMAFQFTDPWMIGPEPGRRQSSLNLAQSAADADGRYTYVVSPVDPGIANWVDSCGMADGFGTMRWQGFPSVRDNNNGLLHDFRIIKLSQLDDYPAIARITPEQRSRQLADRRASFASRFTAS